METGRSSALEWRVYLARRRPGQAVLTGAAVAAVGAWAWYLFGNPLAGIASAGLLTAALGEFLLPVTYRLGPDGAEARNPFHWRRIAWTEVKRVYVGEEEIKLSPLKHAGPREAFRGVVLRCEGNQPAVLEAVRGFRTAAAERGNGTTGP